MGHNDRSVALPFMSLQSPGAKVLWECTERNHLEGCVGDGDVVECSLWTAVAIPVVFSGFRQTPSSGSWF